MDKLLAYGRIDSIDGTRVYLTVYDDFRMGNPRGLFFQLSDFVDTTEVEVGKICLIFVGLKIVVLPKKPYTKEEADKFEKFYLNALPDEPF